MTMMAAEQLTERQRRERDFYRRYAPAQASMGVDFSPVIGSGPRPWNSYCRAYDLIRQQLAPGGRILEIGCGVGIAAVRLAKLGFQVQGLDICPENIDLARRRAAHHQVDHLCAFQVGPAEHPPHPDRSFDLVVGFDILHHVEIRPTWASVLRVLRPGGLVVFREPIVQPLIDRLRQLPPIRRLVPCEVSLDPQHHITPDERKIDRSDLDTLLRSLDRPRIDRFGLLARLHRLAPDWHVQMQKVDHQLFRHIPGLSRLGDTIVLSGHRRG